MGTLHTTTLHGVNRLHAVNKTKINTDCHAENVEIINMVLTSVHRGDDWGDIFVKYQS